MEQLQQVGNFITILSDPSTWVIAGGVVLILFLVWLQKTQTIINLLKDIEKNTRKSNQPSSD
jgi:hypothetical protein